MWSRLLDLFVRFNFINKCTFIWCTMSRSFWPITCYYAASGYWIANVKGYGVVATRMIPKGTITWTLDPLDKIITPCEFVLLPHDLLNCHPVWDEQLKDAFGQYEHVIQPLQKYLPVRLVQEIRSVARGSSVMGSIFNCYFLTSQQETIVPE